MQEQYLQYLKDRDGSRQIRVSEVAIDDEEIRIEAAMLSGMDTVKNRFGPPGTQIPMDVVSVKAEPNDSNPIDPPS